MVLSRGCHMVYVEPVIVRESMYVLNTGTQRKLPTNQVTHLHGGAPREHVHTHQGVCFLFFSSSPPRSLFWFKNVPVQSFDRVSVRPNTWSFSGNAGICCKHHLGLLGDEFFGRHRVSVGLKVMTSSTAGQTFGYYRAHAHTTHTKPHACQPSGAHPVSLRPACMLTDVHILSRTRRRRV